LNLINFFLFIFLFSNLHALTLEEEKKYDELEGIDFIRALSVDKKFQEVILQGKDINIESGLQGELAYLMADAHFQLKNYKASHLTLKKGESFQKKPLQYNLLWGKTLFYLKDFKTCTDKYDQMNKKLSSSDWPYYFECLKKSNNENSLLELSLDVKIQDSEFFLMSQKTLIDFSLLREAKTRRDVYLSNCRSVEFYLVLWDEVQKLKKPDLEVLELGHACHPKAAEITSHLIKAFFNEGRFHSIAYLFEELSFDDLEYLKHTAEFYKVAGRSHTADYFFTIGEQENYVMARFSHFLNKENYAAILTMPLAPMKVSKNQDLVYALAYSNFKFLHLDSSQNLLSQMKKNMKEQQLQALISQCRDLSWRCRP